MIYKDAGSYPLYRIQGTNEISPFVGELAEKLGHVTLNQTALSQIRDYGRLVGFHSVFKEIEWINPYPDIKTNTRKIPFTLKKFKVDFWADLLIENLKSWIKENVNLSDEYWILHSSGGDSRIFSAVFAKLRDEEGFLPNIKFVSWYPEAYQAEKILKYEGWSKQNIWLVGSEDKKYLDEKLYWNRNNFYDFAECGYLTNGEIEPLGNLQSNFWKPYFSTVEKVNIVLTMIADMIMGAKWWLRWAKRFFVNKRMPPYSKNLKWNIIIATSARWNGLGLTGYLKKFNQLLTPTMTFDFASHGVQIPFICRYRDNVRKAMQEKLCPGLSEFENCSGGWGEKTQGLEEKVWTDYYNSCFYDKFRMNDSRQVGDTSVPSFLTLASLYDFLLKKNIQIQ